MHADVWGQDPDAKTIELLIGSLAGNGGDGTGKLLSPGTRFGATHTHKAQRRWERAFHGKLFVCVSQAVVHAPLVVLGT